MGLILLGLMLVDMTQARVVNVDIQGSGAVTYSGQGAYADPGNHFWNSSLGGMIDMTASDNVTETTVDVVVSANSRFQYDLTNDLMRDYSYSRNADTTVDISGLVPNTSYSLYVYCQGDQLSQNATVTFGAHSVSTSGDISGGFVQGGNYVVMTVAADANGEITGTVARNGSIYATVNGLQIVGDFPEPVDSLIHPGMSHKQSDLDRMKHQVEAGMDPWYSSYQEMIQDSKASYNYSVQGDTNRTEIYRDSPYTNKSEFESDSRAAYYNAIRWIVEGDTRYADKAVEIFNAWTGLTYVQHYGTHTLTGSMIYIMLEAAEIIKSTYPGWSAADRKAFGDMLVYPGYSNTSVPSDLTTQGSWYWRVYMGDRARAGNQELSGWRACMAIGIFLDNEIIYERAMRYVSGLPHRPDDLAYEPGPNVTVNNFTNTPYNMAFTHSELSTIPDYGYDGVLTNYVYETGQCAEAARDQGHSQWGLNCLKSIAEMAWTQGDDLWGLEDSRLLLGLEYHTRYNLSYLQSYPGQTTPWEPTVASGEFVQRLNRVARTRCLAINPYFEYDFTRVSRGAVSGHQWELAVGHYVGRGFASTTNAGKWITRTRDYNISQSGYEQTDTGGAHIGWGGLTFRRPEQCHGDPISAIDSNRVPTYAMHQLPGTLQAELYDYSPGDGEGRTFHDKTAGNSGGEFRTDGDVDITTCSEGGYALTGLEEGEWVSYTVNLAAAGKHSVKVRYAGAADGAIRFAFDASDVTGDVILPATGSSTNWTTYTVAENIRLRQGVQSLRLYVSGTSGAYELQSMTVTREGLVDPAYRIQAEACNASSGVNLSDPCSDVGGGFNVGSISDGDWCRYDGLAPGDNARIRFRIARPGDGRPEGRVEVRLGSPTGTLIGSIDIPTTGGWQEWDTFETGLDPVSGSHQLYLVFVESASPPQGGDMCNLNWFELVIPDPPVAPTGLAAVPNNAAMLDLSWNPATGVSEYHLKRATVSGGPYQVLVTGPSVTSYTDSGLLAGTNYYYVISTVIDGSESADSSEVSAVPSDPIDPGDVVIGAATISDDGMGGQEILLSVPVSGLGHSYQVKSTEDLAAPVWEDATDWIPGNGGQLLIDVPIDPSEPQRFYKLEATRQ